MSGAIPGGAGMLAAVAGASSRAVSDAVHERGVTLPVFVSVSGHRGADARAAIEPSHGRGPRRGEARPAEGR